MIAECLADMSCHCRVLNNLHSIVMHESTHIRIDDIWYEYEYDVYRTMMSISVDSNVLKRMTHLIIEQHEQIYRRYEIFCDASETKKKEMSKSLRVPYYRIRIQTHVPCLFWVPSTHFWFLFFNIVQNSACLSASIGKYLSIFYCASNTIILQKLILIPIIYIYI